MVHKVAWMVLVHGLELVIGHEIHPGLQGKYCLVGMVQVGIKEVVLEVLCSGSLGLVQEKQIQEKCVMVDLQDNQVIWRLWVVDNTEILVTMLEMMLNDMPAMFLARVLSDILMLLVVLENCDTLVTY